MHFLSSYLIFLMNNLSIYFTPASKPWPFACPCQLNLLFALYYGLFWPQWLTKRYDIFYKNPQKDNGLDIHVGPREERSQLFRYREKKIFLHIYQGKRKRLVFIFSHVHVIRLFPIALKVGIIILIFLFIYIQLRKMRLKFTNYFCPHFLYFSCRWKSH